MGSTNGEFNAPRSKPFDVAVVGGGIAGVVLTLKLLKEGVPTTLYEQAPQFGEIGAGVSFGPNATRAMKLISPQIKNAFLLARAHAPSSTSAPPTSEQHQKQQQHPNPEHVLSETQRERQGWFDFVFGDRRSADKYRKDGDKDEDPFIRTVKCEGGQQSVHRAHFLDELIKLLPEGVAQMDKHVDDYQEEEGGKVVLRFSDGSTARHDAVAACDGIKSRLRELLLERNGGGDAAHAVFSGKYAYRGLIPMEKAEAALGQERAHQPTMYLGHHGHVLTFPISAGKIMNVVAFSSTQDWPSSKWVQPTTHAAIEGDFEGWGRSVQQIVGLIEDPDVWALFNHPPAKTYTSGRVVLVGDSAHASTPHKGAGAGMAIEDAYIIGGLIADARSAADLESAFVAYDRTRRPRSLRLVEDSREMGQMYDMELEGIGDDRDKLHTALSEKMRWLWEYDLEKELVEAKGIFSGLRERSRRGSSSRI